MKIVLLKDIGVYSKGDVVEMQHARSQRYIDGGFAELAREEKAYVKKVEEAKVELKEAKKVEPKKPAKKKKAEPKEKAAKAE